VAEAEAPGQNAICTDTMILSGLRPDALRLPPDIVDR
jgi:hypothetical protein